MRFRPAQEDEALIYEKKSGMADGLTGPVSQSSAVKPTLPIGCYYVIRYCRGRASSLIMSWGLDSSVGSGFAPWPRGRGFETQPSTVRAPTGWFGVSIM
ncbi:hypothetical protein ElyMa_002107700 [Elysia marginata]|uniref:Uncharacterized protein n=1 Tax=Elysia marginata TaxID=1093978 RepID=A0AAV4FH99_9GAST|nr:hypothetical protein ElyMa_002107700 [Elysia marginata]